MAFVIGIFELKWEDNVSYSFQIIKLVVCELLCFHNGKRQIEIGRRQKEGWTTEWRMDGFKRTTNVKRRERDTKRDRMKNKKIGEQKKLRDR